MRIFFKILLLKLSILMLNRKRREAVLYICVNNKKSLNRVNRIEDVNPEYFKKIDNEINSRNKLIKILSKTKSKKILSLALLFL